MAPEDSFDITFTGLAQRAGAILERMQQCSPVALIDRHTSESKVTSPNSNDGEEKAGDSLHTESESNMQSRSYQGIYSDYPHHLDKAKFALPFPTRAIYNMVLLSYAKEPGPIRIAQQAEDVVWSIIVRATQQVQQQTDASTGHDILLPSIENWNCVLKCWSRNTDSDRAFHAFSFLLSWKKWNEKWSGDTTTKEEQEHDDTSKPNMESFSLVLQSCLAGDIDANEYLYESQDVNYQRAKEMGSGVAIRLWNELQNSTDLLDIDSNMYHQFLQAICQTSELPSSSSSTTPRALAALARVFTKCSKDGMVTPEILARVKNATTESQFAKLEAKVETQ